jgi:predicted permease
VSLPKFASRVYAIAQAAFPAMHRADYAAEMRETFEQELASRLRERGFWHALRFAGAAWLNAVSAGFGERRRRQAVDIGGPRHPFRGFGRDLLHAIRSLAKARAFTFVCVASLGIGMATVIAILTLMRAIVGTPPGIDARGLVEILVTPLGPLRTQTGGRAIETWSYADFVDLRDARTGVAVAGWTFGDVRLTSRDSETITRVATMYVSPDYFTTVGASLGRGSGFDAVGPAQSQPVVIVGHRLWQDRLGADPNIIGSTITLNRVPHVVVAVAPERYRGHLSPEGFPDVLLWLPLDSHPRLQGPDNVRLNREVDWLRIVGRLSPGTSIAQARAGVASVMAGVASQHPKTNEFKSGTVEPYHPLGALGRPDALVAQAMLFGISGVVLLIVCLNVSGMVLVRSAIRERELALRQAIGASRGRLMQYLLSEAVVLALVGGTIAVAVLFGVPALLTWWFDFWHPDLDLFVPDVWTYAACIGLCFVTSLVFGLLPAIRFSRPGLISALKDDAGGGGRRVGRVHRLTAAIQAGIAVPFLVMGGVKLDQVRTTAAADVGFDTKGLFLSSLDLSVDGRPEKDAPALLRTARENLARASGVESVTVANGVPLDFRYRLVQVAREGDATSVRAHTTRVGENFFETMGIRVIRGRGFTRDDRTGAERVIVLSEPLALRLFPSAEPLGQRLTLALEGETSQVFTIVGVTADVVTSQMGTERPQLFVPLAQHPVSRVILIARASAADAPVTSMAASFKTAAADVDPDFNPASLTTGDRLMRRSMIDLTTHSITAVVCASVALALAALGVYGVVGLMVATRTREIGVRMALGASRSRVLGTVLRDAVKVVAPGIVGGLGLAVLLVRVANAPETWYDLGGVEPLAYSLAAAVALFVAMVAGLPSARRAAKVDPILAIRSQ